jgi:hypothetical protein
VNSEDLRLTVSNALALPRADYAIVDLSGLKWMEVTYHWNTTGTPYIAPTIEGYTMHGEGWTPTPIDHVAHAVGKGVQIWLGYNEETNTLYYRVQPWTPRT